MNPPFVNAIILRETPDRTKRLSDHLEKEGIEWRAFVGCNAEKWGLTTLNPYEIDHPGTNYIMPQKHVGLHLSHYWLWRKLYDECILRDESFGHTDQYQHTFLILEDDAEFLEGWEDRYTDAMFHVPEDWHIIMIGSGNCSDKPKEHVKGEIYKVQWPQCTHAMIVKENALQIMIETQEKSWAPIDLALIFNTYPKLNVYTVLPRLVKQHNQEIND